MQEQQNYSFYTSDTLTNMIVGVSDGLSVPFIMVTAFSNVIESNSIIVIMGVIAAVMGGIAMGVGNYLSNKEQLEEKLGVLDEKEIAIMTNSGITKDIIDKMELHAMSNKEQWEVLVNEYGLDLAKPDMRRIRNTAYSVALFYMFAGLASVVPYYLTTSPTDGRMWSVPVTLGLLALFGVIKAKVTGLSMVKEPARLLLLTSTAAAAMFFITGLFR